MSSSPASSFSSFLHGVPLEACQRNVHCDQHVYRFCLYPPLCPSHHPVCPHSFSGRHLPLRLSLLRCPPQSHFRRRPRRHDLCRSRCRCPDLSLIPSQHPFLNREWKALCLRRKLVEQECRTVQGPVEVEALVGAQGASSLEVNVARLGLLPKPVQ